MWTLRSASAQSAVALAFRIRPGSTRTIGRARGVDFVVDGPLVSRVHCRLSATPSGELELEDLDSTNGTYVNDAKLNGKTRLAAGDRLGVGRVVLVVERGDEAD